MNPNPLSNYHLSLKNLWIFPILFFVGLQGQNPFHFNPDIVVSQDDAALPLAWAGGLDNPQFSEIDFNQDGVLDLFIFDRASDSFLTLLYQNDAYQYAPQYERVFPILQNWCLLRDYNNDGLPDIFTFNNGFQVYQSSLNGGEWSFELVKDRLRYGSDDKLIYASNIDIPAIVDVDGDSDLDLLTFDFAGSYLQFYANQSQELYGHNDSLIFEEEQECWGYFLENLSGGIELNACDVGKTEATLHSGSTILTFDVEGDGDLDLLLGDVSDSTLTFLLNGGDSQTANMTNLIPNYLGQETYIFPAAFLIDYNHDGKQDLLTAPNDEIFFENNIQIDAFENEADTGFDFDFKTNGFLVSEMIDVGSEAYPVWVDYNADGLLDIVIGNRGLFNPNEQKYYARLIVYENTGWTLSEPSFYRTEYDFMNLQQYEYFGIFPTFGDFDQDGDQDLITGDKNGRLHYFKNIAPPNAPMDLVLETPNLISISSNNFAAPFGYDVNGDGWLDLVIGERFGRLFYYQNDGLNEGLSFSLVSEFWGEVDVRQNSEPVGFAVPCIYEEDGQTYLLVNTLQGNLFLYTDLENSAFTLLDTNFSDIRGSGEGGLSIQDMDGDGHLDLLLGNARGGISLYTQNPVYNSLSESLIEDNFRLYPNPANDFVFIEMPVHLDLNKVELQLFNVLGQMQKSLLIEGQKSFRLDVHELESGVYFLKMRSNGKEMVKRVVVDSR